MGDLTPKTSAEYEVLGNFVQSLLTSGALRITPTSETVAQVIKNLTKIKNQVESAELAERTKQEKLADSLNNLDNFLHNTEPATDDAE